MLAGSIAALGSHYVITLEAINALTGDAVVREQTEAESKEQVLKKLGKAATKLREKMGESLASIQKFDAPISKLPHHRSTRSRPILWDVNSLLGTKIAKPCHS